MVDPRRKSQGNEEGLTLEGDGYGKHLKLPEEFLTGLGCKTITWGGLPAVEIPRFDENGVRIGRKIRVALTGPDRFRNEKGEPVGLYLLDRLGDIEGQDVTLVEGESDAQTLLFHDEKVLGLPSAMFKPEWSQVLRPAGRILVVFEGDTASRGLLDKLRGSELADRVWVVEPGDHKDVSDLHRADPEAFSDAWNAAKAAAVPLADFDPEPPPSPSAIKQLFEQVGDPPGAGPTELEPYLDQLADAAFELRHALDGRWSLLRAELARRLELAGVRRPDSVAGELLAGVQDRPEPKSDTTAVIRIDPEIEKDAETLLRFPNLLDFGAQTLTRRGLLGEEVNRRVVLLSAIGGLVGTPIHLAIKGASSGGKNTLVGSALELLPPHMVLAVTGMSTHALEYHGGVIEGVLVIDEAEGQADAEYQLRVAMSEGRVSRLTVNRSEAGRLAAEKLEVEISASIITTTTAVSLHAENETRLLDLHIDDSAELTRAVMRASAEAAAGARPKNTWREIEIWRAALSMLQEYEVMIPYSLQLWEVFPASQLRARRDFKKVLALIENCGLLHQRNRDRDEQGRLIASVEDYAMVRPLVQAVLGPSMSGLSGKATEIYGLLVELIAELAVDSLRRVELEREADRRGIASPVTVQKWVQRLMDLGFIDGHRDRGAWILVPVRDPAVEAIPLPEPADLDAWVVS